MSTEQSKYMNQFGFNFITSPLELVWIVHSPPAICRFFIIKMNICFFFLQTVHTTPYVSYSNLGNCSRQMTEQKTQRFIPSFSKAAGKELIGKSLLLPYNFHSKISFFIFPSHTDMCYTLFVYVCVCVRAYIGI